MFLRNHIRIEFGLKIPPNNIKFHAFLQFFIATQEERRRIKSNENTTIFQNKLVSTTKCSSILKYSCCIVTVTWAQKPILPVRYSISFTNKTTYKKETPLIQITAARRDDTTRQPHLSQEHLVLTKSSPWKRNNYINKTEFPSVFISKANTLRIQSI